MVSDQYTQTGARSAASKAGQMIGEAFEAAVIALVKDYIEQAHADYELLQPGEDTNSVTLDMLGGSSRQMDTVIVARESDDPVALLETKWLKDARHHNDKGAWMLQLREVKKKHATVRGAVAILAGYWTAGVGVMLLSEGGIKMVLVATDEEVYNTLQDPLNRYAGANTFSLDAARMRKSYIRPWDLANLLVNLKASGELKTLADNWLRFERRRDDEGHIFTGADEIKRAVDELLISLPQNPAVREFEIALQIDTGNTIYQTFDDVEDAMQFIHDHFQNPTAILERIKPRPRSGQMSLL